MADLQTVAADGASNPSELQELRAELARCRRTEEALRESEARLRTLVEALDQAVMVIERLPSGPGGLRDWRCVAMNPAARAMFGMGDLTGQTVRETFPDEDEGWYDIYDRALATGEVARFEREARSRGMVLQMFVSRVEDPARGRILVVMQDVAARRRAEAELRESEARFRNLADHAPVMVWVTEPDGVCTYLSRSWYAFTGQTEATGLGFGWLDAVHPDDREASGRIFLDATRSRTPFRLEYRLRRADGAWRWAIDAAAPRFDLTGAFLGFVGSVVDITDRKEAEDALRQTNETLDARVRLRTAELMAAEASLREAQKMQAIGQLTGGIAHDFNNVLQGISGAMSMAARRLAQGRGEDAARFMDQAREAALRAAGLTRRLLGFARRQPLEPREVDVDVLFRNIEEMLRRSVGPAIAMEFRLRGGAARVRCDPNELEAALINLCINARDAMPDGGHLLIATRLGRLAAEDVQPQEEIAPGDVLSIDIADTGSGMAPEILARALEPFFTTKPQGQGTGLGLSQVYGFARQSGGALRIDSAPGRGTAVRILLPVVARHATLAEAERSEAMPDPGGDGATVLLVDDEEPVRTSAAEHLRDLGYRVVEARDGPEAMGLLDRGLRPDLLLTDVGLPNGMDGRTLAEEARRRCFDLPVVFATGYAHVLLPEDATVIAKPFDLEVLASAIARTRREPA